MLPGPIQPTTVPEILLDEPMPRDLPRLIDALPDRARDEPQDMPRYIREFYLPSVPDEDEAYLENDFRKQVSSLWTVD